MTSARPIDFHAHIFPDRIAAQALDALSQTTGEIRPRTDGTLGGLLASMDRAGIGASVVASIATKPGQIFPILDFSREIASDRIFPLVSFHPANSPEELDRLLAGAVASGIRGIKLHPMYQEFTLDDPAMIPFYRQVADSGLFLLFHSGDDISFPGDERADPARIARLAGLLPGLTIVASHLGGWRQWERVGILADLPNVWIECSMTLRSIPDERFVEILTGFDPDRILYGSDTPWDDQAETLAHARRLPLPEGLLARLLHDNAARLLRIAPRPIP